MKRLLGLTSLRVCLALSAVVALALCAVPLLGLPGLESALVLGVVLPSFCALIGARLALSARQPAAALTLPLTLTSGQLLGLSVLAALLVVALPTAVLALNGLRVRNCEPLQGLVFIALGPLAGCVLAAAWGALAGSLSLHRAACIALALLGPLGEIGFALYELYATPAVFSYGYFFGYFPGSLYDELISVPWPLIFLRVSSAGLLLALSCGLLSHRRDEHGCLALRPAQGRWPLSLLMGATLLGVVLAFAQRKQLGQATSREHIIEALGGQIRSERCDVYLPRELRAEERARLADDCDFRVQELERFFGVRQRERIAVLAFRSTAEKKALMGAAITNIAKPWRGEVYIEVGDFPHGVLAHELAHIVAGNIGMGPMRITGRLFGLLPDFALIEGVAVAAAWSSSAPSGLSPHAWTRAMLELGIAPRLSDVLGAGFLAQQKRLAYTYVGSLIRYVHATEGSAAVRAIYMRGDLTAALSTTLDALEAQWHSHLKLAPFPEEARALATLRFSGGSVLSTVCPHTRASLKQELNGALAAADDSAAQGVCRQVLELDPADSGVRATLIALLARAGDTAAVERELSQIERGQSSTAVLAGVKHLLADEAVRRGEFAQAHALYQELLSLPQERESLRLLQVKALAMEGSERGRRLLSELLIGEPGRATEGASAVYLARELRNERSDGIAYYLEARQLFFQRRYAESIELHASALQLGLPTPELRGEALRVKAIAHYALRQLTQARADFAALREVDAVFGYEVEAQDWLDRIAFARRSAD